ncbi:substrate-binding domain of hmg-CoA reductase [Aspergillus keveii]|uniref:Substrate-binding domain of hmg-CoA reductase n=1 Tax=Aspergillus keveii TaxID=714993 RepID=A0ABR4FJG3_9EURO
MSNLKYKFPFIETLQHVTHHADETAGVHVENCIGFVPVPVGIAGPLRVQGTNMPPDNIYAPLATTEAAMVASCSRGCKAFSACGGIQFEVLGESMSRAPVFIFPSPVEAIKFAEILPTLRAQFEEATAAASRKARLQHVVPHIIGSTVHVRFEFHTADAVGQNMHQIKDSPLASELHLQRIIEEGQMTSDKKPSWGNVMNTRGTRVMAWGKLTNEVCQSVLRCSTAELYKTFTIAKEGEIRNGQFGSNINAANVVTSMFIATGQDEANAVDGSWCQLTPEFDYETGDLRLSMFFPSLPVGTFGGGTHYAAQSEMLRLLKCEGHGLKGRLAGLVAAFSLALDVSTAAACTHNSFAHSQTRLRKKLTGQDPDQEWGFHIPGKHS